MDVKKLFDAYENKMIELRRWFHCHPELSYEERETSEKIRQELDKMGIPYEVLKPNYGVVATIRGGKEGKTLALRADIDALPVKEETGLPFASKTEGQMHACGHDAHIAMLLGAAYVLNEIKDELCGTVKCLFQVAEEVGGGTEEVLEYFKSIGGIDAIIGLHIWSAIPVGQILLYPGSVFAGGAVFDITITGEGGHGGRPDLTHDPIKAACELVLKLSSIPGNYYDVLDNSVVSTGMVQAGSRYNIIPAEARIIGSLRWFKPDGKDRLAAVIERMAEGVGISHNVTCSVSIVEGPPPVINNVPMIMEARALLNGMDGLRLTDQDEAICAGDDFSVLVREYNGFYGILGGGIPGRTVYPQHHPQFDIDESALRKGSEFMVRYARKFLK